jgi:hypothetical protein
MSKVVGLPNNSYKPITNTAWVRARLCKLQKKSDKVYQLLAYGLWFSLCTPASSTTKTGRHDIAEILLKVALNTKKQTKPLKIDTILVTFVKLRDTVYYTTSNVIVNATSNISYRLRIQTVDTDR